MGVGRNFWIEVGMPQKQEILFGLWDGFAPEVNGKSRGCYTEDTNKMVFSSLDGLLGNISAVVIGGN